MTSASLAFNPRAVVPAQASSRERDDWETPTALFRAEHEFYRFTIDVAANASNRLVPRYFDRERDGLRQNWRGERVWLHPPHGDAGEWAAKADWEAYRGTLVVALMPARTETLWWRDFVLMTQGRARVRFLCGPIGWRLGGLPLEGQRKVAAPRGGFALVEWCAGRRT